MSDVFLLGISHKSSPVALREKLAVPAGEMEAHLKQLSEHAGLEEALLVSTCNRVELYGVAPDAHGAAKARAWLESRAEPGEVATHLYAQRGSEAVRHAFRVASSLDSMVVGEPQILGQVKEAYARASSAGVLGSVLDRCFTKAFAVAKKVRTETGIASGTVSVSSIACDLAGKIFEELRGKRVLLVGAGKMGESAAKHLAKQGAKLFVLNRSRDRAVELAAACGGEPRSLNELVSELAMADIAICSTSSERFVITTDLMKEVARARKYRTLFLIDIAVPRDVDPRVGEMENVFLYDVDDLKKVADENLAARRKEADLAEKIVEREVAEFEAWRRQQNVKPLIVGLRAHVRAVMAAEIERSLPRLGGDAAANKETLDRAIDAATNKLLHPVIAEIKKAADDGRAQLLDEAPRLFGLDLSSVREAAKDAAQPRTSAPGEARAPAKTSSGR
ncbi:MAG: glutamyl-tRNA reductase [Sandaracinaceae bacterium]|nr:glutamyl-tRNA reductase [Sandaracinaceae bacterium]